MVVLPKISTIKIASNKPGNKRQICRGGFDKIFQISQITFLNPPHPTNILNEKNRICGVLFLLILTRRGGFI
jgi:hypothetical protein